MQDLDKIIKEVQKVFGDTNVYAVGGCVRDTILNKKPKDWDFTCSDIPDVIERKIKKAGRRAYCVGKKWGTVGFKVPVKAQTSDSTPDGLLNVGTHVNYEYVEVTTFRTEQYEAGSRKPKVEFVTDLKEDLSRRDLTINAIAYNSEFYDPFAGRLDIMSKKIKAVGTAKHRMSEDPLRMLRVARFASQLGFDVDSNLIGVIRKMPEKILDISRERWVQEMDKLLLGKYVAFGIANLIRSQILLYMLPEVYEVFKQPELQAETMDKLSKASTADEAWSSLLSNIGKPYATLKVRGDKQIYSNSNLLSAELVKGICFRLKFSGNRTKYILDSTLKS